MKRISIPLFMIFMLLFQSCIKEDISTCNSELLLRFRYTLNKQYVNLFDSDVHHVTVYLFDSNGKYVDSFSEQGDQLTNDYIMHIPLPEGKYSVVAYGGDFTTYSVGELNDPGNTLNQTLRKGITDIKDFRMELKNMTGAESYLYPVSTPDDLYAGLTINAVSAPINQNVTDIELIKNTKKIKVKITGADTFGMPLDVYITALNGRYKSDNNLDINHGTFKYTPINTLSQSNYMEANLKTMRLVLGQTPMLVIRDSVSQKILYNENMIEHILSTHQYTSQEDLDRENEFIFEISFVNNRVVSVSINGWIINSVNSDM